MVRRIMAALLLAATCTDAAAQVDWTGAGGDMFGASPAAEALEGLAGADLPRLPAMDQPFQAAIDAAARAHALDPKVLHALVLTESAYRPAAVSPAGAAGLTQLMPETALELGVRDRFDPIENINGGAAYLAQQIVRFGDLRLALAAYNSGPSRVARLGRIPDISETRAYVDTVVECFLALSAGKAPRNARQCRAGPVP